jgi:predicted nuclease of predicted toxin-antitoxin system
MRLLADENVPGAVVGALRRMGHDVLWAREHLRGASDSEILATGVAQLRILVTFDKDFGEIAARSILPPEFGVVLLRISLRPDANMGERVAGLIDARRDWPGRFSVIEAARVRMRPLATLEKGD